VPDGRVELYALIETARSVLAAADIARSSVRRSLRLFRRR